MDEEKMLFQISQSSRGYQCILAYGDYQPDGPLETEVLTELLDLLTRWILKFKEFIDVSFIEFQPTKEEQIVVRDWMQASELPDHLKQQLREMCA